MDISKDVCSSCTALIVTHASKTSPELGKGKALYYPGAPRTDLLKSVISNIVASTNITKFIVCVDHKIDCDVSKKYYENLKIFCADNGFDLIVSPSALRVPSQVSATYAFYRGISALSTDYVLFFEHDHLFTDVVDFNVVNQAFANGCKLLRFNEFKNSDTEFESLTEPELLKGVCETNMYCNKPFLAEKSFCQELFKIAITDIPYWNGHFGGHVEGPISREIMFDYYNLPYSDFRLKYPIFVYGPKGMPPTIEHFGVFTGRKGRIVALARRLLRYLGIS